jgi:hypothetical protein
LERRWNDRLAAVRALEEQLAQHDTGPSITLGLGDRERLLVLGRDLSRAWDSAGASAETRKKIVRLLIAEIIVDVVGDTLAAIVHWQGGDHTRLIAKRNKVGQNRWVTDTDIVDLVRILARQMPDEAIAAVLNRSGKSTGRGSSWTRMRVSSLRHNQDIAPYREGERSERGRGDGQRSGLSSGCQSLYGPAHDRPWHAAGPTPLRRRTLDHLLTRSQSQRPAHRSRASAPATSVVSRPVPEKS